MNRFADRVKDLKGSAIREVFKQLGKPGIISFAGGLPAPELYPAAEMGEIAENILRSNGTAALQYGITEGYAPLVEQVKARVKSMHGGLIKDNDSLFICSGGQQGISLTSAVMLNEGDTVVTESPSFIGGLNSFRSHGAKIIGINMQNDGIDIDELEKLFYNTNISLIYVIPNFQNPTGITMSLEKRKALLKLAKKHGAKILEDNPYGELRFSGEPVPALKELDEDNVVIYVGSFSKIMAPGLRVGFVVCDSEIAEKMIVVKQVQDVHTTLLPQMIISEYLNKYDINELIAREQKLYAHKCGLMLSAIEKHFPANVTYTRPQGGIFLWCDLNNGEDSDDFMMRALEEKVAIIKGSTCMPNPGKTSTFRMNYSTPKDEQIEAGIATLGKLMK